MAKARVDISQAPFFNVPIKNNGRLWRRKPTAAMATLPQPLMVEDIPTPM